jgi:hypothetical protein
MNFAYDQEDIANFYNVYLDLISFWKEIFKDDIYVSKYEKLIDNSQFEIKEMINFCDLEWDPNCLNHHLNKSELKQLVLIKQENLFIIHPKILIKIILIS